MTDFTLLHHTSHHVARHDGHKVPDQGYFKRNNNIVKYGFWTLITLILLTWAAVRLAVWRRRNHNQAKDQSGIYHSLSSKAQIRVDSTQPAQGSALERKQHLLASTRALSYPRWAFGAKLRHLNPPSQGEMLFLAGYWALLMALLWTKVIFKSPVKAYGISWEVVGFRAAWVGTMQFPLLYATGCKYNVISLVTGISHDRLNWFHRWIARTIFMVLIVHWAFFFQEWVLAGFVKQQFETMPMVTWGFIAWGAIGMMAVSGYGWFRERAFEIWLVSHIVLAWAVLALSYKHTACTTYFVGASVGCLVLDLGARMVLGVIHNVQVPSAAKGVMGFGHQILVEALDEQYLRLVINSPKFSWTAGNHVYLTIPSLRMFQSHPFTIANTKDGDDSADGQKLVLIVKKHAGLTKELHDWTANALKKPVRGFIRGPHGSAPYLRDQDTVVFISMGNRASYCTSILQDLVKSPGAVHNIVFHMIVPSLEMYGWYKELLQPCIDTCTATGVSFAIYIHVTQATLETRTMALTDKPDISAEHFAIGRSSTDSEWSDEETQAMMNEKPHPETIAARRSSSMTALEKPTSPAAEDESDEAKLLQTKETTSSAGPSVESQILEGRPSTRALLHESVKESQPSEKIMVVAAISPVLASSLSWEVCRLISVSRREAHSGNIRLWIEQNG